jgi:hypothetical protein
MYDRARGVSNAIVGVVLVGLGLLFLAGELFDFRPWFGFDFWHFSWPFFVIIPGLAFFVGMLLTGRSGGGLAVPGSIITMTGLILLYQNSSNHWESWAYAWALIFPTAIGLGLMIQGVWSGLDKPFRVGRAMVGWGIAIFLVGAVFFEFVLNISGYGRGLVGSVAGPLLLILLGLYLMVRRTVASGDEHSTQ